MIYQMVNTHLDWKVSKMRKGDTSLAENMRIQIFNIICADVILQSMLEQKQQ